MCLTEQCGGSLRREPLRAAQKTARAIVRTLREWGDRGTGKQTAHEGILFVSYACVTKAGRLAVGYIGNYAARSKLNGGAFCAA